MEFGSQSSAIQGVTPCPKKDQVAASESSESSESFDVQKTSSQAIPFRAWLLEMVLLNLVFVMWNTDNWALPAVYTSIGKHFGASPGSLAPLGLVKGVFESVFALPAGFLADRLPRPLLVFVGCSIWSAGLVGCAIAPSLSWMIVFRAVNGVGLGIVQPLLYSLVADKSAAHGRGKAFGALEFTGKLGQTALTAMATAMSAHQIASIGGWQFALLLIAGLSALVGALCFLLVKDEAGRKDTRSMAAIIWEETPRLRKIVCLPTFLVIIGQGIFGTAPWFAFSYLTMWLELNCYSHGQAAVIIAFWNIGGAVSALVGGVVVDLVARRLPDHGPALISQVAVLLSIPMFALILFGLGGMGPPEGLGSSVLMALIFFLTGTMISWCTVMNNKMFADIVPREAFSYVFSLDSFLEGALGASGQPMVAWLTDSVFQFNAAKANASDCSPDNAMKLGKGIFTVAAVGFTLCFMFYSMAHYTYPKDRRAVAARVASGDKEKQREGGSF